MLYQILKYSLLLTTRPPTLAIPTGTGVEETGDLGSFTGNLVNWGLGLIGVVFFLLILFSGIQYATSAGDETKAKGALATMRNAIIGIIIVGLAFTIANTVLTAAL